MHDIQIVCAFDNVLEDTWNMTPLMESLVVSFMYLRKMRLRRATSIAKLIKTKISNLISRVGPGWD